MLPLIISKYQCQRLTCAIRLYKLAFLVETRDMCGTFMNYMTGFLKSWEHSFSELSYGDVDFVTIESTVWMDG